MDVNNLQEEMVKAGFGEETVKPETPEDKETSHNQGKETTVGCIKGKPPLLHKVKAMLSKKQSCGLSLTFVSQEIKNV